MQTSLIIFDVSVPSLSLILIFNTFLVTLIINTMKILLVK
jgi:hypothetical protein